MTCLLFIAVRRLENTQLGNTLYVVLEQTTWPSETVGYTVSFRTFSYS